MGDIAKLPYRLKGNTETTYNDSFHIPSDENMIWRQQQQQETTEGMCRLLGRQYRSQNLNMKQTKCHFRRENTVKCYCVKYSPVLLYLGDKSIVRKVQKTSDTFRTDLLSLILVLNLLQVKVPETNDRPSLSLRNNRTAEQSKDHLPSPASYLTTRHDKMPKESKTNML